MPLSQPVAGSKASQATNQQIQEALPALKRLMDNLLPMAVNHRLIVLREELEVGTKRLREGQITIAKNHGAKPDAGGNYSMTAQIPGPDGKPMPNPEYAPTVKESMELMALEVPVYTEAVEIPERDVRGGMVAVTANDQMALKPFLIFANGKKKD